MSASSMIRTFDLVIAASASTALPLRETQLIPCRHGSDHTIGRKVGVNLYVITKEVVVVVVAVVVSIVVVVVLVIEDVVVVVVVVVGCLNIFNVPVNLEVISEMAAGRGYIRDGARNNGKRYATL
ncbi:hypothetical protein ElyMa_006306100 [Elysia marginata]|uniref:Uncharacterized protein n=1 Tax=Elysia marginata TaxID=1093978 RepID=A0AAV4HFW2_9GAST|nr:hypothetical protein ElyMa_006306100 [Elysia marginata]